MYELPTEIDKLTQLMEEMVGQPREEHHKRQPGEKCSYELTTEDFERAKTALKKANVPGPWKVIQAP